jgi:hypothetical protein
LLIRKSRRASPIWAERCFRGSPTDFGKLVAEDAEKWATVVKYSGAKAD